jgi:hypothetical protein
MVVTGKLLPTSHHSALITKACYHWMWMQWRFDLKRKKKKKIFWKDVLKKTCSGSTKQNGSIYWSYCHFSLSNLYSLLCVLLICYSFCLILILDKWRVWVSMTWNLVDLVIGMPWAMCCCFSKSAEFPRYKGKCRRIGAS